VGLALAGGCLSKVRRGRHGRLFHHTARLLRGRIERRRRRPLIMRDWLHWVIASCGRATTGVLVILNVEQTNCWQFEGV
jgi:hypothetical protein